MVKSIPHQMGDLKEAVLERSRPGFGRAIAYWVLNRDRDTEWAEVATAKVATRKKLRRAIAVALPNGITRKRLPRQRLRCVLGMLSSLEVQVLRPT